MAGGGASKLRIHKSAQAGVGLVDVRVTTPGQLDVDIVRNALKRNPALLDGQRFLGKLLVDDSAAAAFQQFLVERRMSSHAWVIGRKPTNAGVAL